MLHAEFEATNHCNTECVQCPHSAMSRPRGRLSWDTYTTVVDKLQAVAGPGQLSLSFSGMGEPLLHPELGRMVAYASARQARTSFATNGAALTPAKVEELIAAGLSELYVSFNGDTPELFSLMMGGLSLSRVSQNLRHALQRARGTGLQIRANISVTKLNRHGLGALTQWLQQEGVGLISYSMGHTRGGNLRDASVVDTPSLPQDVTHCEVLRRTLFVDWRGRAFICDHDLHGEHSLGDLVTEPVAVVLERRAALVRDGVHFALCQGCCDVLKMGTQLFPGDSSGTLRDWIFELYREDSPPALQSTPATWRWLYDLATKEGRVNRLVQRLIDHSAALQQRLEAAHEPELRAEIATRDHQLVELDRHVADRNQRLAELETLSHHLNQRIRDLEDERRRVRHCWMWPLFIFERTLRRRLRTLSFRGSRSPNAG